MLMNECFFGSVTVGERGQVVIPAEARAEMGIQPGDKLLAMRHPIYSGVLLAKVDSFLGFIEQFKRDLSAIQELEAENQ